MTELMHAFLLSQKKNSTIILPFDINELICKMLVDSIKHEQRDADIIDRPISSSFRPGRTLYRWINKDIQTNNHDWLHRLHDLPAFIEKYQNKVVTEAWWINGVLSRKDNKPAAIFKYDTIIFENRSYFFNCPPELYEYKKYLRTVGYTAYVYAVDGIVTSIQIVTDKPVRGFSSSFSITERDDCDGIRPLKIRWLGDLLHLDETHIRRCVEKKILFYK